MDRVLFDAALETCQRRLGASFDEAYRSGEGLDLRALPREVLAAIEAKRSTRRVPAAAPLAGLSPREVEILRLVAGGGSNQEIADALVLSRRTVETHIANAYAKIGAHGRVDAVHFAVDHGLVPAAVN